MSNNLYAGSTVDVYADSNNVLQAIAFQTKEMRDTFQSFPELLIQGGAERTDVLEMVITQQK